MPEPTVSRRRALAGAAVGGLSLPLLAACGGGQSGVAQGSGTGSGQGGGGQGGGGQGGGGQGGGGQGGGGTSPGGAAVLVAAAKVPVGGGVILRTQNVVVTQPSKGSFEGFSATCTHQGCQLASVAAGKITCPCHGSQFSIKDGSNGTGPMGEPAGSVAPLAKVAVKAKGPNIVLG